jgi:hypothetical protein
LSGFEVGFEVGEGRTARVQEAGFRGEELQKNRKQEAGDRREKGTGNCEELSRQGTALKTVISAEAGIPARVIPARAGIQVRSG